MSEKQLEGSPNSLVGKDEERKIEHLGDEKDISALPSDELRTVDHGARDVVVEIDHAETRRILKKVDYRLVPLLAFLYLVAFVDRSNSKFFLK